MTAYTCITGGYDDLKQPALISEGWKYVCFSDVRIADPGVWEIRLIDRLPTARERRLQSKYYKILSQDVIDDDLTLWVDGSFTINCDLNEWVKKHYVAPFSAPQHPKRSCVYKEANSCIKYKRGDPAKILKQLQRYKLMGLPANNGMAACGLLLRDRSISVQQFNCIWYNEVQYGSLRDQIGFGYAHYWKPIVHFIDYNYKKEKDFLITKHKANDKESY